MKYIKQVTVAQEEERKRIARELHDETAQAIASLRMDIDTLIGHDRQVPTEILHRLTELRDRAEHVVEDIRSLSQSLRPPMLEQLGLVSSIKWMANQFRRRLRIDCKCEIYGLEKRLEPDIELALFRITQEALNNIAKHARASQSIIRIRFKPHRVRLIVSDNGCGFYIPKTIHYLAKLDSLGLLGIQERTHLIKGSLTIRSRLAQGTTIALSIPR